MFSGSLPGFTSFIKLLHLNISSMALTGTLPSDINRLSLLESIDVSFNEGIVGPIPSALRLLPNLKHIDISETTVSGSVSELIETLPAGISK